MSYYSNLCNISALKGLTMASVEQKDDDEIIFTTTEGGVFRMMHIQDCCESVSIEEVIGDLQDLVGSPILVAEDVSNEDTPPLDPNDEKYGSYTWTFYKLSTIKGSVTLRWYGSSNGYYSESVDLVRETE